MKNKLIHEYELENIYIFSMTCKTDLMYWPFFKLYVDNELKPKIYDKIDFKWIENLIKEQESVGFDQMIAMKKEDVVQMKKVLFIYDDMMQDKLFKWYDSQLSMFSCLCWHYNISQIILTQKYNSIPNTIRLQSSLVILLTTDNYSENMIWENAWFGEYAWLLKLY